jgi:sensor histidine kinase regulating citrate/malate metabolism
MEESDIYSLFGNALSNAIESVSGIQDEDKRCISLNVRSNSGLLSIHVENYYQGEIEFENGLPKTKKDQSWHGFGMKSMALIASKYKGSLTSTAVEDIFYLDVILPINNSK